MKGKAVTCSTLHAIKVDSSKPLAVFPAMVVLPLEVKEWDGLHLALFELRWNTTVLLLVAIKALTILSRDDLLLIHG